jgi:hypothetical protein
LRAGTPSRDRFEMEHSLWKLLSLLWPVNLIGSAVVAWRLYSLDLHRKYRFFFLSTIVQVARSVALLPFSVYTPIYYEIWVWSQPLLWLSYILVVHEVYSLVLKQYAGIYSVSRWFFFVAVAISSVAANTLVMSTTVTALSGPQRMMLPITLVERSILGALGIFLFLLRVLVTWFPVPLSRNLLIHATIYAGYFFTNHVFLMIWQLAGKQAAALVSDVRLLTAIVCYASWIFLLSRSGEERTTSLSLGRSEVEERRLLGQLQALNSTLIRTAHK